MAELVTLELPEELVRHAKELAANSGRTVEDVLTHWIEQGSATQDISPLRTDAHYPIFTPYGNEQVAHELWEILKADEAKDKRQGINSSDARLILQP